MPTMEGEHGKVTNMALSSRNRANDKTSAFTELGGMGAGTTSTTRALINAIQ